MSMAQKLLLVWQAAIERWPVFRPLLAGGAIILGLLAIIVLPDFRDSAMRRERGALADLRQLQRDLTDIDRLRQAKPPQATPSGGLQRALTASVEQSGMSLTVASIEQDQLSVKGESSFDVLVGWLSMAQETHRLSVIRMSLHRKTDAIVTVDIVLAPIS